MASEQYKQWADGVHAELVDYYGVGLGDIADCMDLGDCFEDRADAYSVLLAAQWCVICLCVHENEGDALCDTCAIENAS